MSLLRIPPEPVRKTAACLVCTWRSTLTKDEQTHLATLVQTYNVAELFRALSTVDVPFAESTLRSHVRQNH